MEKIIELLNSIDPNNQNFPPTLMYNEGWLLRIILEWFSKNRNLDHKLWFHEGASWFSEAQLPTPFGSKYLGDKLGEKRTNVDGVIGQFVVGSEGKTDFVLLPDATQFVVLEAKMFSKLAAGIKFAPTYDQAARTVACMAEAVRRAGKKLEQEMTLGFYLLAPESQLISKHIPEMKRVSIQKKVKKRVDSFKGEKDDWHRDWFLPLLDLIGISIFSWEEIITYINTKDPDNGNIYKAFFDKCVEFN